MIRVQEDDFDSGEEAARLTEGRTDVGALVTFTGLVRDFSGGDGVEAMTLEHYPGMTEKALKEIDDEARARWPLSETLIVHRHGRLAPGDRIVFVAVASAHREAAFEAAAFLVDWLKTKAPFWKREEGGNGSRWVAALEEDETAARRWQR